MIFFRKTRNSIEASSCFATTRQNGQRNSCVANSGFAIDWCVVTIHSTDDRLDAIAVWSKPLTWDPSPFANGPFRIGSLILSFNIEIGFDSMKKVPPWIRHFVRKSLWIFRWWNPFGCLIVFAMHFGLRAKHDCEANAIRWVLLNGEMQTKCQMVMSVELFKVNFTAIRHAFEWCRRVYQAVRIAA